MRKVTQERRNRVLELVQGGQKVSIDDVAGQLEMNPQSAANLLRDMYQDKELARGREGRTTYYSELRRRAPRRRTTETEEGAEAGAMESAAVAEAPAAAPATAAPDRVAPTPGAVHAAFSFEAGRTRLQLTLGGQRINVDRRTADYLWRILGAFLSMPAVAAGRGRDPAASTPPAAPESAGGQGEAGSSSAVTSVIPEGVVPETAG